MIPPATQIEKDPLLYTPIKPYLWTTSNGYFLIRKYFHRIYVDYQSFLCFSLFIGKCLPIRRGKDVVVFPSVSGQTVAPMRVKDKEADIMKVTYEKLMERRRSISDQITLLKIDPKNLSVFKDLREQIREIDTYIAKNYPEKVMSI